MVLVLTGWALYLVAMPAYLVPGVVGHHILSALCILPDQTHFNGCRFNIGIYQKPTSMQ